jgi:hypothetical protein
MKPNRTASIRRLDLHRETLRDLSILRRASAGATGSGSTPVCCVQPTTTVQPTHQVQCLTTD